MKKALLIFCATFMLNDVASAQSQEQGNIRFHAFGTYGLRYHNFGAGAGIEYFFVDKFAMMPSYTFVFPQVGKESNFSADLRYYVSEGPSQLYFMAGYSQTWQDTQPDGAGTIRNSKGANVGVGAYIRVTDAIGLSTEFRFQSPYPREVGFRVGLAIPL
ncbi:outer membrane protein with beta-barrel domain [Algoriphagus ratkowskyi]|uniref:Outer membrane protein with beta-barrel domain n=1 Tax=Algoriphagus ratkowskyi TaxID=57028 RepID=A0A2W7RBN7_9BACT|nr:outer membrane beta-barrel protein [Algoriphagus ratkowskyi]PZX58413.1 outer membrane protein with beta-barrel domain [Algoriphagus ratkowskyi]TXD77720.1 porin family protein [Algoriphagus ratkowskyi]